MDQAQRVRVLFGEWHAALAAARPAQARVEEQDSILAAGRPVQALAGGHLAVLVQGQARSRRVHLALFGHLTLFFAQAGVEAWGLPVIRSPTPAHWGSGPLATPKAPAVASPLSQQRPSD